MIEAAYISDVIQIRHEILNWYRYLTKLVSNKNFQTSHPISMVYKLQSQFKRSAVLACTDLVTIALLSYLCDWDISYSNIIFDMSNGGVVLKYM